MKATSDKLANRKAKADYSACEENKKSESVSFTKNNKRVI
jgi:hypothetical protein